MKIPTAQLRRVESLEARVTGPGQRPEDRLSFGELASLPDLAPDARQRLLRAAQRRTQRQVAALRHPELDLVEAAFPAGAPVTLQGLAALMHGTHTSKERRVRALAFLAVRDLDLVLVQQLHTLATADH